MNQHSHLFGAPRSQAAGSYVCWTRMQAEAGQSLAAIVRRKELEREAGGGTFFWGVGNAPSGLVRPLARTGVPVPVIFSVMKSAPKKIDEAPSGMLVWNGYLDNEGVEREIPRHVLVTSRSETGSGPKTVHYALICRSDAPLEITKDIPFDHRRFRNAGTGGAIGASQVTALLEPASDISGTSPEYRQNLIAQLTGSYWVKLTRPRPLPAGDITSDVDNIMDYRNAVAKCRQGDGDLSPSVNLLF